MMADRLMMTSVVLVLLRRRPAPCPIEYIILPVRVKKLTLMFAGLLAGARLAARLSPGNLLWHATGLESVLLRQL